MSTRGSRGRGSVWRSAVLMGLVSSSFSTLVVALTTRRIGRSPALSWMEVATVALSDRAVRSRPTGREIIVGILVHQFADFGWANIFYGLGARRTRRLPRPALLALLTPWAALTAAAEYWLILPWLQPLLRMQAPYWIGLGAHVASGLAYPLYPWLREIAAGERADDVAFARRWAAGLAAAVGLLAVLEVLGQLGREVRWPFAGQPARAFDQGFLRRMVAHQAVGVELARLAAERAERAELRMLGRLMLAEQQAEIDVMRAWWRGWYGGELPPPTPGEHATMPGMPPPGTLEELGGLRGPAFEERFLDLMIRHHEGAIRMADEAWRQAGDPRLRLLADQIRHPQKRQVARLEALRRVATGAG